MEAKATSSNSGYSITLMAAETCSIAILAQCLGHGKSPCFLRLGFFGVVGVDGAVLVFACLDVEEFLECA